MSQIKFTLLLSFLAVTVFACAGSPADAYKSGTDSCSDQFISDMKNLKSASLQVHSVADLNDFENKLNNLESHYHGAVCRAPDGTMFDVSDFTSKVKVQISKIRAANGTNTSATSYQLSDPKDYNFGDLELSD